MRPGPGTGRGRCASNTSTTAAAPCQYLAAWDVHRAKLFGRCEPKTGIEPFGRLVDQVMSAEPYASARRVFWVVDNGSSHRGQPPATELIRALAERRLVQLPVHASWLNQVEIYFSVIQRKVLTPNDFADLAESSPPGRLRAPLRAGRRALRVEVHPRRPRPADEKARRQAGLPAGRMSGDTVRPLSLRYVIEIMFRALSLVRRPWRTINCRFEHESQSSLRRVLPPSALHMRTTDGGDGDDTDLRPASAGSTCIETRWWRVVGSSSPTVR